ncbi:MAG: aldo/keto reductase [Sulfolobales archaeon]|nr:aldo/keto reductase [Sulfolobales archaeon]MDW8082898.1 aldo/keto reductase [Sulfolobales archaeon]
MSRFPVDYLDRKPLGRSGEFVSAIGLGTWGIKDEERARTALIHAVELGMNLVDTAEMYGNGRAEEFVGRVIREVGRESVFVTTKLYPHRFRDPERAVKAAESSLRRLGIRHVDLVLIHWPDDLAPIRAQIRSLEAIAEHGLTRYIGLSNFSLRQIKEAIESTTKFEIVVNQVKYSILDRSIERDLLSFCIDLGITIMAYSPLEKGAIVNARIARELASRYSKTPVQIALNYLISRPRVVAIPKAERVEHVEELKESMGWRLRPEDIELVEKSSY